MARRAAEVFGLPGRPRPEAFWDILERMLAALDLVEAAAQTEES